MPRICERHGFDQHTDDPTEPCVWCGMPRNVHREGECRTCLGNGWRWDPVALGHGERRDIACPTCAPPPVIIAPTPQIPTGAHVQPHGTGIVTKGHDGW